MAACWAAGWGARAVGFLGQEGAGETMLSDQPFVRLLALNLVHVLEEDSFLFLRLRPDYRGGSAPP